MNDSRFKLSIPHCSLCQSPYDMYYHVPLVIPKCGHSFCQKCIQNKVQTKGNRRMFICPECNADIPIRKGVSDELPRNISIIDVVKNIKKNIVQEEPSNSSPQKQCIEHQKPLQIVCITCKNMKICSHCAMFGSHKGHEITDKMPITKSQLEDLKQYYEIVTDAVNTMITPKANDNILLKSKKVLSEGLQKLVKLTFQQYYDQIAKKQTELLQECQQIQIHGQIGKTIDHVLDEYDLFKMRYEACSIGSNTSVIDDLFDMGKNINSQIEAINNQVEKTTSEFLNESAKQLGQAIFFRINEISSSSVKGILTKEKEEKKSKISSSRISEKRYQDLDLQEDEIKIKETPVKEKKKVIEECKLIKPPTAKANYSRIQSKIKQSNSISKKEEKQEEKKEEMERNKSKTSRYTLKQDQEPNLKYTKPMKQINYELRPKLQNILHQIDKQEVGGTLELINNSLNQTLVVYICEHLRTKKMKFSMMKLLKNGINDEGMKVLLSYLSTDNFTKVLNLTGNQLTQKSLDLLVNFVQTNNILKTIYLSNNKINSIQLKNRKKIFEENFVEVII